MAGANPGPGARAPPPVVSVHAARARAAPSAPQPVAGNYYPVSSFIYASSAATGATLSVAVDRAQGGSSVVDGALELMLHRRLLLDDRLGVGEALTEPGLAQGRAGLAVRATHVLSLEAAPAAAALARRAAAAALQWAPTLLLAGLGGATPAAWAAAHVCTFSGLAAPLPANVHLLTAHALGVSALLLRLAHAFEAGEGGAAASADASVDLAGIFAPPLALGACTEMTVTGSQPLADVRPTTYNASLSAGGGAVTLPVLPTPPQGPNQTVTLSALQIRTFLCDADFGPLPPITDGGHPAGRR
jgi:hypothetical protein